MSYDRGTASNFKMQIGLVMKMINLFFTVISLPISIPMRIVRRIYLWRYKFMENYYGNEPDEWKEYWLHHEIWNFLWIYGFLRFIIIPSTLDDIALDYIIQLIEFILTRSLP